MPVKNNSYSQKDFNNDLQELEKLIKKGGNNNNNNNNNNDNEQNGGKKDKYTGTYRHFKLYEVNGKPVDIDSIVNIKEHHTPINAAKKLLRSYCNSKKLSKNDKYKIHITFSIRETTRGSDKSKSIYGPYTGRYHKYTPEEMKKATYSIGSGKKLVLTMKPVVKLHKKKNVVHKGGVSEEETHHTPVNTTVHSGGNLNKKSNKNRS
jgi:hypothetical protein